MHGPAILVVDDDEVVRHLLVEYLQARWQASIEEARDGVEALHQIALQHYGVIVLDVMMPKMSGVDLLDSLKAMMSDSSLKPLSIPPAVLVITSTSSSSLPAAELEHRFPELVRGVFRKPLDMHALGERVETLIS